MQITFKDDAYTAETPLGTLTGLLWGDGTTSVHTPYTPEGKDTFVYINRIGYRFSFSFRADGGTTGGNMIYREGKWLSNDGVTAKASSTIWEVARDVHRAIKAHPGYAAAIESAKDREHASKVRDIESKIAALQKELEKVKAQRP